MYIDLLNQTMTVAKLDFGDYKI